MIPDAFGDLAAWFVGFIATWFPDWQPPAELVDFGGTVNGLVEMFAGLGGWVDFVVLAVCTTIVLSTWVVAATIKLLRAVAAHIPLVGGAG